ncbi:acetate--CoA ligase family protein [Candidatus Microgenomates bacterium]|nr:acetate--CoA ligase family protein [Candidatus Microgenomates bacterium]
MILYEFEGKKLLVSAGISVPNSQLIESASEKINLTAPLVLKAQVLSGKRKDVGGIVVVDEISNLKSQISNLLRKEINKEKVEKILVEEKVDYEGPEYYISISYDTDSRGPVLTISESGGTGVEERKVQVYPISPLNPDLPVTDIPVEILQKLVNLFFDQDMLLLEINPLVKTKDNQWLALDAKINLDDTARDRHQEWNFPPRAVAGHSPTEAEIAAKKIDEGDYRGTAGSTYFDLDGDIAILASGGGASLTAMDALLTAGGKPANYTEYSGNPPREKVTKLTQIVLSKPNLHGLWIVGAVANFTDIYETLSGFTEALRQVKPKPNYPIVIRRGGPRDTEAFEMLKNVRDFDLHIYGAETSINESAKIMSKLAKTYAAAS